MWRRVMEYTHRLGIYLRIRSRDDAASQARIYHKVSNIGSFVQSEDWAALRSQFSPLVRWFLTESVLRTGFDMLRVTTGPIVHVGTPVISHGWLTTAKLPVQFKNVKLVMVLQMTAKDKLFALRFWPQKRHGFGNPWQSPPYAAEPALWDETSVHLGSFKLKVTGTLATPRKPGRYPCIVMLPGSGPCDRDSSVEAAKPFKDLAWGLAGLDVATLRFDKVTFAHGSRLCGKRGFTLTDEYMEHAESAVRYCLAHSKILKSSVFVLGHSLGGYVAPHLANAEYRLAGCIIMAAPTALLYWSALRQLRYLAAADPDSKTTSSHHIDEFQRKAELADGSASNMSTLRSQLPFGIGPAYWLDFRNYSPVATCQSLRKPILIAQGGRDYQVTAMMITTNGSTA